MTMQFNSHSGEEEYPEINKKENALILLRFLMMCYDCISYCKSWLSLLVLTLEGRQLCRSVCFSPVHPKGEVRNAERKTGRGRRHVRNEI